MAYVVFGIVDTEAFFKCLPSRLFLVLSMTTSIFYLSISLFFGKLFLDSSCFTILFYFLLCNTPTQPWVFGASLVAQRVKNLPASAGDAGSIPGSGRSPGEGNDNPLQHSWLENPMDRGAWRATVQGVAKSWTWLSNFHSLTSAVR